MRQAVPTAMRFACAAGVERGGAGEEARLSSSSLLPLLCSTLYSAVCVCVCVIESERR